MKNEKNYTWIICIVGAIILLGCIIYGISNYNLEKDKENEQLDVMIPPKDENSDQSFFENENKEQDSENDSIVENTYETEFPEFNDVFEKAMFIYSWFYDNSTLLRYVDTNNEIEEDYYLLMIDDIKSIDDMKKYSYEVFDRTFIDYKFNEIEKNEMHPFKNHEKGVIVNFGYVTQYSYDIGYSTYEKNEKSDDLIVYRVPINGFSRGDTPECDVIYEYNLEKNIDGKYVFKSFEHPTNICSNDIYDKID